MSTIRQYFDTDFDHMLRVHIAYTACDVPCDASLFYDANANSAFLAFYFGDAALQPSDFERVLETLKYGASQVSLRGGISLPSARVFHGSLRVQNENPFKVEYRLFGDPAWRDLLGIPPSRRVFIYAETSFTETQIALLIEVTGNLGHELQFRDAAYANRRTVLEKPLAFISHDSRDKESIARPIALNLQRKICPVWYDEFSLQLGAIREMFASGFASAKMACIVENIFEDGEWAILERTDPLGLRVLPRSCGSHCVPARLPGQAVVPPTSWTSGSESMTPNHYSADFVLVSSPRASPSPLSLGISYCPMIIIEPYNPIWPVEFSEIARQIQIVLEG